MPSPKLNSLFSLCLLLLVLSSCDSNRVFEENKRIPEAQWNRHDKALFEFEIQDSLARYNFYFNFRHAGDYPYKNLYLFVKTTNPLNQVAVDTAQMILADHRGKWMGKGIGDIYDYQFKFKEDVAFPAKGIYTVEIEQAMRDEILENVTDIGIRIEKVDRRID